jgi:hypothetical protein
MSIVYYNYNNLRVLLISMETWKWWDVISLERTRVWRSPLVGLNYFHFVEWNLARVFISFRVSWMSLISLFATKDCCLFHPCLFQYYQNSGHYPSPSVLFKHNVPQTGFCIRLQVEPAQLGPIDRWGPSSIYWAQLSRSHMKTETESRTMDNVQNCDSYINIPSSQTYRSCLYSLR